MEKLDEAKKANARSGSVGREAQAGHLQRPILGIRKGIRKVKGLAMQRSNMFSNRIVK